MEINTIFRDKYKIVKVLGEGGMGKVYLAENMNLGNKWAIKEIRKDTHEKYDFLAEPNILKKLNHPSLPRIFDIFEDEKAIYIIEDFIPGEPLDKMMKSQGKIPEKTVVEWAKQLCKALMYMHNYKPNAIIYRDMKPGNLIVNDDEVKIIDFGIAREFKEEAESDTTYMGTRGYAAPEQMGTAQTDNRTDIYSLGITLYHLVTGKGPNDPPFEILPVTKLDRNLSKGIEHIIMKCTQQNPSKRYQKIEDMLHDLENIHKFAKAYKKKKIKSALKTMVFMGMLSGFSYLTYAGHVQMDVEKNEKYVSLVDMGVNQADKGEYTESNETLNQAMELIPERIEAYEEMANGFFKKSEYDECIDYIVKELPGKGVDVYSSDNLMYLVGTCYFNKEEYENAKGYIEKATNLQTSNIVYNRDLAVCYAKTGDVENAKKVLQYIEKFSVDEAVSWYVNGEILAASGLYEESLDSFNKCIEIVEDEDVKRRAFMSQADVIQENGESIDNSQQRLVNILERAQKKLQNRNDLIVIERLAEAYYNLAIVSSDDQELYLKKAAENFEKLMNLGYNRIYLFKNVGGIYKQLNELDKAEEIFNRMRERYPEDYSCYEELAFLYAEMENRKPNIERNYDKTLEFYKLAIEHSPKGEDTQQLKPLMNLIEELRRGNWIKE